MRAYRRGISYRITEPEKTYTEEDIAVRPWAVRQPPKKDHGHKRDLWFRPPHMLTFHCIASENDSQGLLFGYCDYQDHQEPGLSRRILFFHDRITDQDKETLRAYARVNCVELMTLGKFRHFFYEKACFVQCLVAGHRLPYQIMRIVARAGRARTGIFKGGFSCPLFLFADKKTGKLRASRHYRRIKIKVLANGSPMIRFGRLKASEKGINRPTGGPGEFIDTETLAFALTGKDHESLASACRMFEVPYSGTESVTNDQLHRGAITTELIKRLRDDVTAIAELTERLLAEFSKHRINLEPTRAFSPSSLVKAYLRDMGIPPILERQPDFQAKYLGYAMSSFYGGKMGVFVRKQFAPVVYLDFRSNYVTVSCLMGLWLFLTAERINIEHCKQEALELLWAVAADPARLYDRDLWERMCIFVKIIPNGDLLPVRTRRGADGDWRSSTAYVTGAGKNHAMWFAIPDLLASIIAGGRVPEILDAFKIVAEGRLETLSPFKLRGEIPFHPADEPFYKVAVEERQRLKLSGAQGPQVERLAEFLKIAGNSAYGIFCEVNRDTANEKQVEVICYGREDKPDVVTVRGPEDPGEYCFPPLASLTTAGARLLLAMVEREVRERGGGAHTGWVMGATDSIAIVGTPDGRLDVNVQGADFLRRDTITPLPFTQVQRIIDRFEDLNPYDPNKFRGSILGVKLNSLARQVYCYAIATNKHAFYAENEKGELKLITDPDGYSKHTVGNYLSPLDPDTNAATWIEDYCWSNFSESATEFDHLPAVQYFPISSFNTLNIFQEANAKKDYWDQIKPFNMLIKCSRDIVSRAFKEDEGDDILYLIRPYTKSLNDLLAKKWRGSDGKLYQVRTLDPDMPGITVASYAEVLNIWRNSPERSHDGLNGEPSGHQTRGELIPRKILIREVRLIGKSTNDLSRAILGMVRAADRYIAYDRDLNEEDLIKLRAVSSDELIALLKEKDITVSRKRLNGVLSGRFNPGPELRKSLVWIATRWESPEAANDRAKLIEFFLQRGWSVRKISDRADLDRACVRRFLKREKVDNVTIRKLRALRDQIVPQQVADRTLVAQIMEGLIDVMPED